MGLLNNFYITVSVIYKNFAFVSVKVNVNNASTILIFRSTLERKYHDLRFKIKGEQISDDCLCKIIKFITVKKIDTFFQYNTFAIFSMSFTIFLLRLTKIRTNKKK